MPYITNNATSLQDLLDRTIAWVTDVSIHGADAWELIRNEPWPRGTIFKAKGVRGKGSCYIGLLLVKHVLGHSYTDWLFKPDNFAKHVIRSTSCMNLGNATFVHSPNTGYFTIDNNPGYPNPRPTYYSVFGDIVKTSGSCLSFGVFKNYDKGLDWNEQPGCLDLTELAQYPIFYSTNSGSYPTPIKPPIYPGVGYPGIGMNSNEPLEGYFKYWLVKDHCRLTIITNNSGQWDMGHAGMLVPFSADMQYAFPAVIAGSCTGLRTVATTSTEGTYKGGKIDYSYNNYSLSRSMPAFPATNAGDRVPENSQLGVCLADGTWKFFSNWSQRLVTNNHELTYYYTVPTPSRNAHTGYCVKPTDVDLQNVYTGFSNENSIVIEPLDLWQENSPTTNMLGSLWNMYWPGSSSRFGETLINGKKHLLMPNGWENRPWAIPNYTDVITNDEMLIGNYNYIAKYSDQFKILVKLED